MNLPAGFWKRFYLVVVPLAALIVIRDALLDFYFFHRADTLTITFYYNITVWILWLLLAPAIAFVFLRILTLRDWRMYLLWILFAFSTAAIHQLIHHFGINSNMTYLRLAWGALMVSIFLAFLFATKMQQESKENAVRASILENQMKSADLHALTTRLDSEKLFMTLRKARETIGTAPKEAEESLATLADQLRKSLRNLPQIDSPPYLIQQKQKLETRKSKVSVLWRICLLGVAVGLVMAAASILDDVYVWKYTQLQWNVYWDTILSWVGVAILTPLIFWMSRFQPGRRIVLHIGACIIFWCAISGTLHLIEKGLDQWQASGPMVIANGLAFGFKFDVYGAVLIAAIAVNHQKTKQKEELRVLEAELLLTNAQLEALKMQIHPHFLFNSLNSVMELIHQNPAQASELLERLEYFLRITLTAQDAQDVPLKQELDFVECYLDMQKVRFPKRLSVQYEFDERSLNQRVPVLLLQPIVENAVRHGIANVTKPGQISIETRTSDGILHLKVRDTGPGMNQDFREGIGINNTKRRLEHIYGRDYRFEMKNEPSGGLTVLIEIPAQ